MNIHFKAPRFTKTILIEPPKVKRADHGKKYSAINFFHIKRNPTTLMPNIQTLPPTTTAYHVWHFDLTTPQYPVFTSVLWKLTKWSHQQQRYRGNTNEHGQHKKIIQKNTPFNFFRQGKK